MIQNPEHTHTLSWSATQRHARRIHLSEDEDEDEFWSAGNDSKTVGKADKVPPRDGNPPISLAWRASPKLPVQGEKATWSPSGAKNHRADNPERAHWKLYFSH